MTAGLVERRLPVLVLDGDEGAPLDEVGRQRLVVPEAGVVQRGVAVLVNKVHVRLVLQQLEWRWERLADGSRSKRHCIKKAAAAAATASCIGVETAIASKNRAAATTTARAEGASATATGIGVETTVAEAKTTTAIEPNEQQQQYKLKLSNSHCS